MIVFQNEKVKLGQIRNLRGSQLRTVGTQSLMNHENGGKNLGKYFGDQTMSLFRRRFMPWLWPWPWPLPWLWLWPLSPPWPSWLPSFVEGKGSIEHPFLVDLSDRGDRVRLLALADQRVRGSLVDHWDREGRFCLDFPFGQEFRHFLAGLWCQLDRGLLVDHPPRCVQGRPEVPPCRECRRYL